MAAHDRIERADRIDLGDDYLRPEACCPVGDRAPARAVASDHDGLAGQQDIRGPQQPVDDRLAGPVAVVEHAPGHRDVGGHDREGQRPGRRHLAQPRDPGRGGLAAADDGGQQFWAVGVQRVHQVAPVVNDQVGRPVQRPVQVGVVRFPIDSRFSVNKYPRLTRQCCRDVVLGR